VAKNITGAARAIQGIVGSLVGSTTCRILIDFQLLS
jgi:hypothetical protein